MTSRIVFSGKHLIYLLVTWLIQCQSVDCDCTLGCHPIKQSMFHSHSNYRTLEVSSTCGETGPTTYEYPESSELLTCYSGNYSSQYLRDFNVLSLGNVNLTVGNYDTNWQSQTLNESTSYQWVVANFTDKFLFNDLTLRFDETYPDLDLRPRAMSFEKLDDTGEWEPMRYYAINCTQYFPDAPKDTNLVTYGPEIAACEEKYYSGDTFNAAPFVIFYPFDYEKDLDEPGVQALFTTSAIRINLVSPSHDKALTMFYAVSDISLMAQCACFGHADTCTGPNGNICECQHNTQGAHCEECQPLFHNRKWDIGTSSSANECQDCGCGGYADSCVFDENQGYGVCQNCRNNTTGDKCDKCLQNYYKRSTPGGPHAYECSVCDCGTVGTAASSNFQCDSETGTCTCKANVEGRTCDTCRDTFWNLNPANANGCQDCDCHLAGTLGSTNLCNKTTGVCICKANTMGARCDLCKAGSYNLTLDNPDGCDLCGCDPGSSQNTQCSQSGVCTCKQQFSGEGCRTVAPGRFVGHLDYLTFEAETLQNIKNYDVIERTITPRSSHTGVGFLQVCYSSTFRFEAVQVPTDHRYDAVIRLEPRNTTVTIKATFSSNSKIGHACGSESISAGTELTVSNQEAVCLKGNVDYTVDVEFVFADNSCVLFDSLVMLPTLTDLKSYNSEVVSSATKQKMQECNSLARGGNFKQREDNNCYGVEFSLVASLFDFQPPICDCDTTGTLPGTTCDPYGGQCQCKAGVAGLRCDRCEANHFGFDSGNGCTACQCDPLGSTSQACSPSGECSCKNNVDGEKCDKCFPGFYGRNTGNGCIQCVCNGRYAIDTFSCDDYGKCLCKPGVNGLTCEACRHGFFNLTDDGCESCNCDPSGSTSMTCDKTSGVCPCKNATTGDRCSKCIPGYFGVGDWNEGVGCIQCYCTGHSSSCSAAPNFYQTAAVSDWSATVDYFGSLWDAVDDNGNFAEFTQPTLTTTENSNINLRRVVLVSNVNDNVQRSNLYFRAIDAFLGNKQSAYGNQLEFELSSSSNESIVTSEADIIIRGRHAKHTLVQKLQNIPGLTATKYSLKIHEDEWFVDSVTGQRSSFQQMMHILYDVSELLIRAKFSNASGAEVKLFSASLGYATPIRDLSTTNQTVTNVELCNCPTGYKGQHCEECDIGYRRSPKFGGIFSSCVPCECNGHGNLANPCNASSGVCDCIHNTHGDHCEMCLDGYHGNATLGSPGDCQPCLCPGNVPRGDVNTFASTCTQNATGFVTCDNCAQGHVGAKCDSCSANFYGQPANSSYNGGQCRACECNGYADTCDVLTGVCAGCRNNTSGMNCQQCAPGFYGDPLNNKPCKACDNCLNSGSTGQCDHRSGQCECRPFVEGFNCTQCVAGSFNYSSGQGCQKCFCNEFGSNSSQCDQISGQCPCRSHVLGLRCDSCESGFYNLNSITGCDECLCNTTGSSSSSCDLVTGQCLCNKPSIGGRMCNQCRRGSSNEYSFVEGIYIGIFPDCELCGDCFDSWARKIDAVGTEIQDQYKTALIIWNNYDNMTAEELLPVLAEMRRNISAVNESIVMAQKLSGQLQYLKQGYNDILVEIQRHDELLVSVEKRFSNLSVSEVSSFDGQISVGRGVTRSPDQLKREVNVFNAGIESKDYAPGNASWESILNITERIYAANETMQTLKQRVSDSLKELGQSESKRKMADDIVNGNTTKEIAVNSQELDSVVQSLDGIAEKDIERDIATQLEAVANEAASSVEGAATEVEAKLKEMEQKVVESQNTLLNASQAQSSASNAQSAARTYKALAMAANINITTALEDLQRADTNMVYVTNSTETAANLSALTQQFSVRKLPEMKNITHQINQTSVSEEKLNSTFDSAVRSEQMAQELMNITQDAQKESQLALSSVESAQLNLAMASGSRNNTGIMLVNIESRESRIKVVTQQTLDKANGATSTGTTTNNVLQRFKEDILGCEQTFALSQSQTDAGLLISQEASNTAGIAERDLKEQITALEGVEVDTANKLVEARTSQSNLQGASDTLETLGNYLNEAENLAINDPSVGGLTELLDLFKQQNFEMSALERELGDMEIQLDKLITDLAAADVN